MHPEQDNSRIAGTAPRSKPRCSCATKKPAAPRFPPTHRPLRGDTVRDVGLPLYELLAMTDLMREAYVKGDFPGLRAQLSLLLSGTTNLASALSQAVEKDMLYAGQIDTVPETFDLVELVREVIQTARLIVGNKPVSIMDASSPSPFFLYADRAKIKKIMMEIVSNAAQFTYRGRIAVITDKDDDHMRITVTDTGLGMTSEQLNAFFPSPGHTSGDASDTESTTGRGLMIARRFVALLKGRMTISSKHREGTIIEISLPISKPTGRTDNHDLRPLTRV